MTRHLVVMTCWTISATATGWLLFSDGGGLVQAGPWACIGLTLIGLGVAKQMGLGAPRRSPAGAAAPARPTDTD